MITILPTKRISALSVKNIYDSFTHKMAAKAAGIEITSLSPYICIRIIGRHAVGGSWAEIFLLLPGTNVYVDQTLCTILINLIGLLIQIETQKY